MRRLFLLCTFVLLLTLARSAGAADPACPTVPAADTGVTDLVIDLANGPPTASLTYGLKDRVRVVFKNRNPFLRYDVKIQGTEQAEPALAAFTSLFALTTLTTKPPATGTTPSAPAAAQQAQLQPPPPLPVPPGQALSACWTAVMKANNLLDQAKSGLVDLNRSSGELGARLAALKIVFSAAQDTFNSNTVTCELLQRTGRDLRKAVADADPKTPWNQYQKTYDNLFAPLNGSDAFINQLDQAMVEADARCDAKETAAREQLAAIRTRKSNLLSDAQVQAISKERADLDAMINDIFTKTTLAETVLASPESFYFTRPVGPFSTPTIVTVAVRTRTASATDFPKDSDFAFSLNFGGPPRFSLSVGIAATRLETREYSAVQGLPLDTHGMPTSTTLTSVVGLKDSSSQRITPMLLLNTRITGGYGFVSGIHFSLGLSGKVDNLGTDVEYLTGFSFGFAENRAFLTLGAYNGRVQTLQPGFYVGSPLGNVAQPSVRKDRHWKPMIALSYKFM
jgi:hypothetical protein